MFFDALGVMGSVLMVLAFALLQSQKILSTSVMYPALNLAGALMLTVSLLYRFNLAALLLEVFWALISAYGLVKNLRRKSG